MRLRVEPIVKGILKLVVEEKILSGIITPPKCVQKPRAVPGPERAVSVLVPPHTRVPEPMQHHIQDRDRIALEIP